jgi:hypothetical protein
MSSISSFDARIWYFINVDSRLLNGVAKGTLLGVDTGGGALRREPDGAELGGQA